MTRPIPTPTFALILSLAGALAACSDDASGSADTDTATDLLTDQPADSDFAPDLPTDLTSDPDGTDLADAPPDGDAPTDPSNDLDPAADADPATDPTLDVADDAPAEDADPTDPDSTEVDALADPDLFDAVDLFDGSDADALPLTCDELTTRIDSLRTAAATCERSAQCALRANPLCPFGGCFTYYRSGTDLAPLEADEQRFRLQACSSMHCACPLEPPVPFCEAATCGPCPTVCPYECALDCECARDGCNCDLPFCAGGDVESCEALGAALVQAADDLAGCTNDGDCVAITTGVCSPIACRLAINSEAGVEHLESLVGSWQTGECADVDPCVCPPDGGPPSCTEGRCRLP